MTIVSLTANTTSTKTATAPAMIYHNLFYDSNKTLVVIIYFWFFLLMKMVRELSTMKETDRGRGGCCCCFLDGNDNGYADNDCNSNDDGDD
jgi:hypothetical protein